jgi:hypothetical protein
MRSARSDEERRADAQALMAAHGLPITASAIFAATNGLPVPQPATADELDRLRQAGRSADAEAAQIYGHGRMTA